MFQKQRAALSQITNILTGICFVVLALTLIPKQDVSFVFAVSVDVPAGTVQVDERVTSQVKT